MRNYAYIVLKEHKEKILASGLDPQVCYEMLNMFIPRKREDDWVMVSAKSLKEVNYNYKQYINFFVNNHLIFSDNYYSVDDKICRHYRLRQKSCPDFVLEPVTNLRFINRRLNATTKNKRAMRLLSKKETFRQMKEAYIEFMEGLDTDKMLKYVSTEQSPGHRLRLVREIYNIKDQDYYFKRNSTNERLDTTLTNMRGEYKFFHKRDDLSVIDIKNSQPFFLSYTLSNIYSNNTNIYTSNNTLGEVAGVSLSHNDSETLCKGYDVERVSRDINVDLSELKRYENLCVKGQLYEHLAKRFNCSREEAKEKLMKIFYSSNKIYLDLKNVFKNDFPTIYRFIEIFKEVYGYEGFAIYLQYLESSTVLDKVCRVMVTRGIVPVTIHDSWIVPTLQVNEALQIIKAHFFVAPSLAVEHFKGKQKELNIKSFEE